MKTEEIKTISVLGSTGSIGRQTLDIAEKKGLCTDLISFGKNISEGEAQIRKFHPRFCCVSDEKAGKELAVAVADTDTKVIFGENACEQGLSLACSDVCINGIGGFDGLLPTLSAIKYCRRIGLANKESIVAGGDIVLSAVKDYGRTLIPVDSEHSTIFRCLAGEAKSSVRKLIITCSGGAFYGKTKKELESVTVREAVTHPNWKMGNVITINCATLINKGLEIIEASRLFDIPEERIEVVIHRESIIHSLVEYNDFAVKALLSVPDMRIPIQYAIDYPFAKESPCDPLDLVALGRLTFAAPDTETFPLLDFSRRVLRQGGVLPCVMNAANEVAVGEFLCERLRFCDIAELVMSVTEKYKNITSPSLEDIQNADREARRLALAEAHK